MDEHWDAIIIGAGLGGLTAAARLSRNGVRVLVLEKNRFAGGTAYVFNRGGFAFPMGPIGFGNPDLVLAMLAGIGLAALDLKRVDYGLLAFGKQVLLSGPPDRLERELASIYPRDARGIFAFFKLVRQNISFYQSSLESGGRGGLEVPGASASQYLEESIADAGLRRILGSIGTAKPYSGLDLLIAMWILMSAKGIHYPSGGMKHLSDSLAGLVRSAGGRLDLGHRVASIKTIDGRARGVILADGREISADAVISNADFKNTFLHLLPRPTVPSKLYHDISIAPQTMSNLQVCLGLDPSSLDLSAFKKASRLIYRRNGNFNFEASGVDWRAPEVNPAALAREELEIDLLSLDDPLLAPPNGATLLIRVAADYGHFARFMGGARRRAPGYVDYKTRLAKALVSEVAKVVPGLDESILVMDIGTPLTFEEFGGRSEGAVAGWSWNYLEGDSGAKELILTPISGLYMAGYQAFSSLALGGVPSAMRSGLEAASYLMENAGPIDVMDIPVAPS